MTLFCQRNVTWGLKNLGFSPNKIWKYGCTITCLSMIHGTDPGETNNILKGGGGYSNGDLVNWVTLHHCIPSFTFVNRFSAYDNQVALNAIQNYGFVIVMVDAGPIGAPGETHFVVFVGNHRLLDPWTGKNRPVSDFSGTNGKGLKGMVVLQHT